MCFVPAASLVTAATEFGIAGYLFKPALRKKLLPLIFFLIFLGLYQLTEFFLCTTDHSIIWAKIGFIIYTFLPTLLTHSFINLAHKKFLYWLYLFPLTFTGLALLSDQLITQAGCNLLHVTVSNFVFNSNPFLLTSYLSYYTLPILVATYFYTRFLKRKPQPKNLPFKLRLAIASIPLVVVASQIYLFISAVISSSGTQTWYFISLLTLSSIFAILALSSISLVRNSHSFHTILTIILVSGIIQALLLYLIIPNMQFDFASIYCQFALLYGLAAIPLVKHPT